MEFFIDLPTNLNASPLYLDPSIDRNRYTYDSIETVFISLTEDFYDFNTKLAFIIRYSSWQPGAYEPGPFRELLWDWNLIRPAKARKLLRDFDGKKDVASHWSEKFFYSINQAGEQLVVTLCE